jgi:hypothetical protein
MKSYRNSRETVFSHNHVLESAWTVVISSFRFVKLFLLADSLLARAASSLVASAYFEMVVAGYDLYTHIHI